MPPAILKIVASGETSDLGGPNARGPLFSPGQILEGKYELIAHLATGGQAVVWRARHLVLDRLVAIKILRHDLAREASIVSRFVDEARILAAMESEYVARILDYGSLPDGVPFMVMEHLEGRDMRRLLMEDGRLPVAVAASFVVQACTGVNEAHRHGIIHRDIKPENLFVCDPDSKVKVLDFGISRELSNNRHLTNPGEPIGSPSYMAPEQLTRPSEVDGRADVWALGAVLHELIGGACAFEGATVAQTCALVMVNEPRRLAELRAGVPTNIQLIVDRCLSKDAALRFNTAHELATALLPYCAESQEPASAAVERHAGNVQRWNLDAEEAPTPRWGLFILIVLTLAVAALALHQSPRWLPLMTEFFATHGRQG